MSSSGTTSARAGGEGKGARSQTLERSLEVLRLLSDGRRRSSHAIATEVGLHRSIVYRMLRTFEDYGIVARDANGKYLLGLGLTALAGSASRDLQARVATEVQELADATRATALFCTAQHDDVVVLASARPAGRPASVMVTAGSRWPLTAGAPGTALASLLPPREFESDEVALARRTRLAHSKGEPFVGLAALAVPLRLSDGQAAALCVLAPLGDLDTDGAAAALTLTARRLSDPGDDWEQ